MNYLLPGRYYGVDFQIFWQIALDPLEVIDLLFTAFIDAYHLDPLTGSVADQQFESRIVDQVCADDFAHLQTGCAGFFA
ncbi:hypothetical protein D3C75_1275040 [compost metagenome]